MNDPPRLPPGAPNSEEPVSSAGQPDSESPPDVAHPDHDNALRAPHVAAATDRADGDRQPLSTVVVAPSPQPRYLTADDLTSVPRRRVTLPVLLFVATCLSTMWVGITDWMPLGVLTLGDGIEVRRTILTHWQQGLIYMGAVLAILLSHEMGHFAATLVYRIPASLPYFIPFPISPIGTMGAVIGMAGFRANRRQLFDIGLAGPLAGLAVAIPILWIGIAQLDLNQPRYGVLSFDCPWLVRVMIATLKPEFASVETIAISQLNPYFMAAWVGLLITGLNMMPISQLDGGHVIYALFLKRAHWIARTFLVFAIAYVVFAEAYIWTVMIILVTIMGTDHPRTADDKVSLGWFRTALGYASLVIPFVCFPPRGLMD